MPTRRTPDIVGQGKLDVGEIQSDQEQTASLNWDKRTAASSLIKFLSNLLPPDPSEVSERDVRVMSPRTVASGLYVPDSVRDSDVPSSFKGVIFPPEQFLVIARSPRDLAKYARTRTQKAHEWSTDKDIVDDTAKRSALHELRNRLAKIGLLAGSLSSEEDRLRTFSRELHSANGTGFYSHYSGQNLNFIKSGVETSIYDALNIAATTHGWDREKTLRAKRALHYQLYGTDVKRIKNWIGYTDMVGQYTHARLVIINQSSNRVEEELKRLEETATSS